MIALLLACQPGEVPALEPSVIDRGEPDPPTPLPTPSPTPPATEVPPVPDFDIPILPLAQHPLDGRPITSPYGPRRAGGHPELHIGVDWDGVRGEPVYAALSGSVRVVRPASTGGESLMIILEHPVDPFRWQGTEHDRIFTSYHHLESFDVDEDELVQAGQVIGTMGDSGNTERVHVHFELRLGTHCSLEYQLANPDSSCVTGFSPHVDPMHILPTSGTGPTATWDDLGLVVSAPLHDPDIRRLETDLGILDFDEWLGLSNASDDERDTMDRGWVTLDPLETDDQRHVRFQFDEAPTWVEVYDVHGARATIE